LQKHPKIVTLPLPWVQSPPSGVVAWPTTALKVV
jgi:hypothetical protein